MGFKFVLKNVQNDLHITKISLYFAPALMNDILLTSKVLKMSFSKKTFQNIWIIRKDGLSLHPLRWRKDASARRKFLRRSWKRKKSKKIWKFEKLALPLHHFPAFRSEVVKERSSEQNWNKVLWRYWAAKKVLSTLAREWFQTIPLRLELRFKKFF